MKPMLPSLTLPVTSNLSLNNCHGQSVNVRKSRQEKERKGRGRNGGGGSLHWHAESTSAYGLCQNLLAAASECLRTVQTLKEAAEAES